jgi:hypothetical protein
MPRHTPEEKEKRRKEAEARKRAGQQFIGEREKIASRLIEQGRSPAGAKRIATREITGREKQTQPTQAPTGGRTIADVQKERERIKGEFEEKGFLEGPERIQLDIEKKEGILGIAEKVPVFGNSVFAIQGALRDLSSRGKLPLFTPKKLEPLIQDPETIREIALQEIQKEVISEGVSFSETFGTLVESIPVVGKLVSTYASGLVETPSGNVNTLVQNILNEKERALNTAEMVRSGRLIPSVALERLNGIDDNIARLEQRIKLMANISPILRSDGDAINKIETEILRARERIQDARTSAFGEILEPTDSQVLLALRDLKGG